MGNHEEENITRRLDKEDKSEIKQSKDINLRESSQVAQDNIIYSMYVYMYVYTVSSAIFMMVETIGVDALSYHIIPCFSVFVKLRNIRFVEIRQRTLLH